MATIPDEPVAGFWTPTNMKTYKTAILELQAVNPFSPTFNQAIATRTAAQNVGTSSWTQLGNSSTDLNTGSGFVVGTSGIACTFSGWVRCEGVALMAQNSSGGRRLLGFGPTSASQPVLFNERQPSTVNTGATISLAYTETLQVTSGDILCMFVWQDSGSTLVVVNRKITVTRVA